MTLLEAILAALTVIVFFSSCALGFLLFSILSFAHDISFKLDQMRIDQGIPDDLEDYLRPMLEQISRTNQYTEQIQHRLYRVNQSLENNNKFRRSIIRSELMNRNIITPETVREIIQKANRISKELEEEGVKP